MNTKLVVGGILLLVLLGSAVILASRIQQPPPTNSNVNPVVYPKAASGTPTSEANSAVAEPANSDNRYVPYTAENFARVSALKRVLYFHADWCPICVPLDKEFSSMMNKIPTGLIVFKVNYDREQDLKKKYAITYQHTFVQVDAQGNEVTKWSGGGIEELKTRVQ